MPSTTKGLPYPSNSDDVDVPGDIQALAEAVDTELNDYLTDASASSTYQRIATVPSPNRNLLYNGAMQVSQRGTSTASITAGGYYTADRWSFNITTQGTWTQSVENDAPTGSGFRKSLKLLCTTADAAPAAGDMVRVTQSLEGQDCQRIAKGTSSAQQLTLSFWVKSNVTGTYIAEIVDGDNTRFVSASYTISASATWERKTITFPADTTGAFDNDNAESLALNLWLGAGSTYTSGTLGTTWHTTAANRAVGQTNLAAATNNYWQITGVQLETGSQATAFEFKSFGQELRECQRYYQLLKGTGNVGEGAATGTTQATVSFKFLVTMRVTPTVTIVPAAGSSTGQLAFLNSGGNYPATIGSNAASNITADRFSITGTGYTSAFTGGNSSVLYATGTDVTVWNASAEL